MPCIDAGCPHLLDMRGIARPKQHLGAGLATAGARGEIGESGPPGSRSENGNPAFAARRHPFLPSLYGITPSTPKFLLSLAAFKKNLKTNSHLTALMAKFRLCPGAARGKRQPKGSLAMDYTHGKFLYGAACRDWRNARHCYGSA